MLVAVEPKPSPPLTPIRMTTKSNRQPGHASISPPVRTGLAPDGHPPRHVSPPCSSPTPRPCLYRLFDKGAAMELISSGSPAAGTSAPSTYRRNGVCPMYAAVEGARRSDDAGPGLRERFELVPRDADGETGMDHVLHLLHRGPAVAVAGLNGRDQAAVASDNGGDAVEAGRRERWVPEHLGVVVRVDVDEPGAKTTQRSRRRSPRSPDRSRRPGRLLLQRQRRLPEHPSRRN